MPDREYNEMIELTHARARERSVKKRKLETWNSGGMSSMREAAAVIIDNPSFRIEKSLGTTGRPRRSAWI
ncbi:MAG: hypothetical protein ACLTKE_01310 [Coprococcus sp.]